MLTDVVEFLRCPTCGGTLHLDEASLRCPAGHTFDVARQGYVNLLAGGAAPPAADTADMVDARDRVLEAGHFGTLTESLAAHASRLAGEDAVVLDAGAGPGHHLRAVLDRVPGAVGLAVDTSPFALRRAARAHPRAAAVGWDVWRPLPVRSGAVSLILDVFAPRNGAEFRRVLEPGGALLVAAPTARHLGELVDVLGLLTVDERKDERLAESLSGAFTLERKEEVGEALSLSQAEAELVARMGPSAHHVDEAELRRRVQRLGEPVSVTVSVDVSVYRPL